MVSQYKSQIKGYRIADKRHAIFSGNGAQRFGGRWNPIGKPVIYASLNLSCAMLELLVHLNDIPLPTTHKYIEIYSDEKILIEEVEKKDFKVWNIYDDSETKKYGNRWLEELRSTVLIVPSIIIPHEKNIIINPNHQEFKKLKSSEPKPINWDPRLF